MMSAVDGYTGDTTSFKIQTAAPFLRQSIVEGYNNLFSEQLKFCRDGGGKFTSQLLTY